MPKYVTRSSWFWVFFASLSFAGMLFSYYYFPRAFPLINLDLEMNRTTALEAAKSVAIALDLGPSNYNQAASFEVDNETKTFVELEGGGKQSLNKVLADNIYSPYHWVVRHFAEHNPHELRLYFNPNGTPYGFSEKIPEDHDGPAITQDEAQALAEKKALEYCNIDFSLYKLIEVSHEEKPNKRLDHTFVYERTDNMVGKAHYRLTLVVQGNKLTKVKPSLQVPEAFKRRYEHMRSANKTIGAIALFFMFLLYILGCCLGGLFYLYRRRMLNLKIPMVWACIIATFQLFNSINTLPLAWLKYDTATSHISFLVQLFLIFIVQWGFYFSGLTLIFAAAEGLSRCAFGNHPKLWTLWNNDNAASWQVLGRTVGGYLIVGLDIAFVVIVYAFSTRYLGWWTPSEALINPDILATYLPWFSSIAQSAMAGFMEECLFRALPLATAVLIGKHFNRPRLFLILAFIIQAVIFGAAHASYPAQPAYARLLELIIPSAVFGGLYLIYGLLPAIISHFVYDVVWFALPLFVTKAPGSLSNQIMVIVGASIPLAIVLLARFRKGSWKKLDEHAYNRNDNSDLVEQEKPKKHRVLPVHKRELYSIPFLLAGAISLLILAFTIRIDHDGLELPSDRSSMIAQAQALSGIAQTADTIWRPLTGIKIDVDPQHIFVWRTYGKDTYKKLLGTYLAPACWLVRFASFEGDIAERAEEYRWYFGHGKSLLREQHILPEDRPGISLTKKEASLLSMEALEHYFNFTPADVQKISSVSSKKTHRTDWTFTYHTQAAVQLGDNGQTRTTVTVADATVSDIYRHIFVPEKWLRQYTHEKTLESIFLLLCYLLLILLFSILAGAGALPYGLLNLHYPTLIVFGTGLFLKSIIQLFNLWPIFESIFSTSQPYWTQGGNQLIILFIQIILLAAFYGYLASILYSISMHSTSTKKHITHIFMGISAGALYTCISVLLKRVGPVLQPLWPDYSHLGAHIPWLSMALFNTTSFITLSLQTSLIFLGIDHMTQGWQRNKTLGIACCLLLGIAITGTSSLDTISWCLISGSLRGVVLLLIYIYSFRYERIRIIWAVATLISCTILQQALFGAWPGVLAGGVLSIALIILISTLWSKSLYQAMKE